MLRMYHPQLKPTQHRRLDDGALPFSFSLAGIKGKLPVLLFSRNEIFKTELGLSVQKSINLED